MSVHYKFKSTLDFDTITFDGLHISVGDLKRAIIHQKRLGKIIDFDLQITNAQTKEEYDDDSCLIPKNTSLVIARIPLAHQTKKLWDPQSDKPLHTRISASKVDNTSVDLSQMKVSEEDKIEAMMLQSTADYDPKSYQRIRGQSQTGEVPSTYRCNKCKKGGHWIKNCPFGVGKEHMDIKRNTGIPRSFRDKDDKALEAEMRENNPLVESKQEIPEELLCGICNDIFVDAVMIPCCGSSFCDDCVRTALLESEDNECPDCKEKGSSPGSLIPNRFLRNSVNAFKNETGYKSVQIKEAPQDESSYLVNTINEAEDSAPTSLAKDASEDSIKNTEELIEVSAIENSIKVKPNGEKANDENLNITTEKKESPSHEEIDSDYEDNITVTMPIIQTESQRAVFRDRPYNGRNSRHPKPPGIESSPRHHMQPSLRPQHLDWDREADRDREYREIGESFEKTGLKLHKTSAQPTNVLPHYSNCEMPDRAVRGMNSHEMFAGHTHRAGSYQQVSNHPQIPQGPPVVQGPQMGSFDNMYNQMGPRPTSIAYPHYVRPIFHNVRPGYTPIREIPVDSRQALPSSSLASVYQGVAAKVGTGIIDDPLEAFNRIMKEKEKRKEGRRRSSEHRRSRSIDRQQRSRFRLSPHDRRLQREPHSRDKRARSRDRERRRERGREKRERDKPFRYRRSNSFSDRSSRSRSWSNSPPKKRSKSPIHNRSSRSRTNHFGEKFRQVECSHSVRRDDEFRQISPIQNVRRSRSRGRLYNQQQSNWYPQNVESSVINSEYGEKYFKRNLRFSRENSPTPDLKREFKADKVIKGIKSTLVESMEPPPPGFEETPCRHWTISKQEQNQFMRSTTPDLYEKYVSRDLDESKIYNTRDERSWSRLSNKSFENNKKCVRSLTPKPVVVKPDRQDYRISEVGTKQKEREKRDKLTKRADKERKNSKERDKITDKYQVTASDIFKGKEKNENSHTRVEKSEKHFNDHQTKKTEKDNEVYKMINKDDDKSEKKFKERKKKTKKEKNDKKKLKKDKKEKRDRDKHRNVIDSDSDNKKIVLQQEEILSNDLKLGDGSRNYENECSKTPDLKVEICVLDVEKTPLQQPQEHAKEEKDENFFQSPNVISQPLDQAETKVNFIYRDICEEGELSDDDICKNLNITKQIDKTQGEITPISEFKRFDSVLDIHGYETDFDESNYQDQRNKVPPPIPEPSKWERDDANISTNRNITRKDDLHFKSPESGDKVTNEVLRKAENAIFARAINAIRPIEIRKVSAERQKLCSTEILGPISKVYRDDSKEKMKTFQITVPVSSSQERSVEIKKDNRKRSHSPKLVKSIKERLGSKIVNKSGDASPKEAHSQRNTNRSHSTDRNYGQIECRKKDKERSEREKDNHKDSKRSHNILNRNFDSNDRENKSRSVRQSRELDHYYHDTKLHKLDDRSKNYQSLPHTKIENRDKAVDLSSDLVRCKHYNSSHKYRKEESRDKTKSAEKSKRYEEKYQSERKSSKEHKRIEQKNENLASTKHRLERDDNSPQKTQNLDITKNKNIEKESKHQSHVTKEVSSSVSSDTDSESESDETKRKKKRKYKKDKKRAKRSSSAESTASLKRKHIKNKKKNKSARKKKKSKK